MNKLQSILYTSMIINLLIVFTYSLTLKREMSIVQNQVVNLKNKLDNFDYNYENAIKDTFKLKGKDSSISTLNPLRNNIIKNSKPKKYLGYLTMQDKIDIISQITEKSKIKNPTINIVTYQFYINTQLTKDVFYLLKTKGFNKIGLIDHNFPTFNQIYYIARQNDSTILIYLNPRPDFQISVNR